MNTKQKITKELIASTDLFWKASHCGYCQAQFTLENLQPKKYRLFKIILSSEILVMLFHQKCWTKFNHSMKEAWKQIQNDPIYRWSMGKT